MEHFRHFLSLIILVVVLAGCAGEMQRSRDATGLTLSPQKATSRPYQIKGVWYYPQQHYELDETGIASHYGDNDGFDGKPTATGERFDMDGLTAAHKTLPLPCIVTVINLENGKSIELRVNDRGPFVNERIIDVSRHAAKLLGFYEKGTAKVRVVTDLEKSLALNAAALAKGAPKVEAVMAVPVTAVSSKPLEPIMAPLATTPPMGAAIEPTAMPQAAPISVPPAPVLSEKVVVQPVVPSNIYLTAGSYGDYNSAMKAAAGMSHFAPQADVIEKQRPTRLIFQVRLGPIESVQQADQLLDQLIASGYKDARIVIMR